MTKQLERVIAQLQDLVRLPESEQKRIATRLQGELDKLKTATHPQGKRIPGLGGRTVAIADDFDAPLM